MVLIFPFISTDYFVFLTNINFWWNFHIWEQIQNVDCYKAKNFIKNWIEPYLLTRNFLTRIFNTNFFNTTFFNTEKFPKKSNFQEKSKNLMLKIIPSDNINPVDLTIIRQLFGIEYPDRRLGVKKILRIWIVFRYGYRGAKNRPPNCQKSFWWLFHMI